MAKNLDLLGKKFGNLTVVKRVENDNNGSSRWLCRCDCGNEIVCLGWKLNKEKTISCGCVHRGKGIAKDIGKKYGKLTVIKRMHNVNGKVKYLCKCDCGNEKVVYAADLRNGKIVSCGCYRLQKLSEKISVHKKTKTRLYRIWQNMKTRCYNPKFKQFKDYGGKGVSVCEEWKNDFMQFYNWAMSNGYNDTLTIDRIDTNGNYEPDNCRWATLKQQARNNSKNVLITHNGETHCLTEWGEIQNINLKTLYSRIYTKKWSIEKALEFKN